MSRSVNKVILVGNVGSDPNVQSTANGTVVAHISLATSRRFTKNGQVQDVTEWHRLTMWNKVAEIVRDYVRKGDRLYVDGRIEYGTFEKNGVTIPTCEINVQELVMLGGPKADSETDDDEPEPEPEPAPARKSKPARR